MPSWSDSHRALVVGASSAIGRAIAVDLAGQEHQLVLWGPRLRQQRRVRRSKHGLAGQAGATFLDVRDRGVKGSVVPPGLVAAGAGLLSAAGRQRPAALLAPADVAAAVRFVVTFPAAGCPTEIELQPQLPRRSTPPASANRDQLLPA